MQNELKTEMHRAVYNYRFLFAILIGIGIAVIHVIVRVIPVQKWIYFSGSNYPLSAYEKWLGVDNASVYNTLYYFVIPILAAIPFTGSLRQDIQSGYIQNIVTRISKTKYFLAKYITTFIVGGLVTVIPLIVNFILTTTVLPLVVPQSNTIYYPITQTSILGDFFYAHPLLYVFLNFILNFVFLGFLQTLGLLVTYIYNRVYSVILFPFILYLFLYALSNITGWYFLCPFGFLSAGQALSSTMSIILSEIGVMLILGGIFFYVSRKKEIL